LVVWQRRRSTAACCLHRFVRKPPSSGFDLLADLSAIGVDYQGAGVVTTRAYRREAPDTMRRSLRAYVEALHRFKTDNAISAKVIGKDSRMTEPDALEES